MDNSNNGAFWNGLNDRVEKSIKTAQSQNRKVCGANLAWHLFLAPLAVFTKSLFLSGGIFKRRQGLREAVHSSVLLFLVNARLYEIEKGDMAPLKNMREEWLEPGSGK